MYFVPLVVLGPNKENSYHKILINITLYTWGAALCSIHCIPTSEPWGLDVITASQPLVVTTKLSPNTVEGILAGSSTTHISLLVCNQMFDIFDIIIKICIWKSRLILHTMDTFPSITNSLIHTNKTLVIMEYWTHSLSHINLQGMCSTTSATPLVQRRL
jgi:hypothetical protein